MNALRRNVRQSATDIEDRIKAVLADVGPLLRMEHCSLAVAGFEPASGELTVEIRGTCPDCSGSPVMFATAIGAHVKQRIPEVRAVVVSEIQ